MDAMPRVVLPLLEHEGYGAAWEELVQWRVKLGRSRKDL